MFYARLRSTTKPPTAMLPHPAPYAIAAFAGVLVVGGVGGDAVPEGFEDGVGLGAVPFKVALPLKLEG